MSDNPAKKKVGRPLKPKNNDQSEPPSETLKQSVGRPPAETAESDNKSKVKTRTDVSNVCNHINVSPNWKQLVGDTQLHFFPQTKLPTNRAVMQRYHALKYQVGDSSVNTTTCAKVIFAELKQVWDKAYIPTLSDKVCEQRI